MLRDAVKDLGQVLDGKQGRASSPQAEVGCLTGAEHFAEGRNFLQKEIPVILQFLAAAKLAPGRVAIGADGRAKRDMDVEMEFFVIIARDLPGEVAPGMRLDLFPRERPKEAGGKQMLDAHGDRQRQKPEKIQILGHRATKMANGDRL